MVTDNGEIKGQHLRKTTQKNPFGENRNSLSRYMRRYSSTTQGTGARRRECFSQHFQDNMVIFERRWSFMYWDKSSQSTIAKLSPTTGTVTDQKTYSINEIRQNMGKNSSVAGEWTVQFRKECVKAAPSYPFHFTDQESAAGIFFSCQWLHRHFVLRCEQEGGKKILVCCRHS